MLIACRAWSRFNVGERLAAHIAAGGCGCEIPCDGCKQSERVLPRKIALGVTGNHIIDAFVPYRRAHGRIMTSMIGFFRGLAVRTRQPHHENDECRSNGEAHCDDDAQTRFDMNRIHRVETVVGQGDDHALPPRVSADGAFS